MNRHCWCIIALILSLIFPLAGCTNPGGSSIQSPEMEWAAVQPIDSSLFARADEPREFIFPEDHGAHPDFQTEWWYFTGNLLSADDSSFGYQLTFFRRALLPPSQLAVRASDLAVDQIYMAHFTLTDVTNNQFHPFQRLGRGDGKMAGATADPFLHVWLGDWQINQMDDKQFLLHARENGIQIDLTLNNEHGVVLQGDNGLSRKSATTASYYYSMPRLTTKGTVRINNKEIPVNGSSWMDHEFSTSTLASDQVGWDWFAFHLDDDKDVMLYTLRRNDGAVDPYSRASIISPNQPAIQYTPVQYGISPINNWKSPHSGAVYPSGWKLIIPAQRIDLTITPLIKDQELNLAFTYWEGAVLVDGLVNGIRVSGTGYVELTGYVQSMNGQF